MKEKRKKYDILLRQTDQIIIVVNKKQKCIEISSTI